MQYVVLPLNKELSNVEFLNFAVFILKIFGKKFYCVICIYTEFCVTCVFIQVK